MAKPTTCSVLTPPGAGAIGIIRLEGWDAEEIAERIFQPTGLGKKARFQPDTLLYGNVVAAGEVIDNVLMCRLSESAIPRFDITAHGGVRVIERILEALDRRGVRLAESRQDPDRLWKSSSTIESEANAALNHARTGRAVRLLAWQRQNLADHVRDIASLCSTSPTNAIRRLEHLIETFPAAHRLLEGATVALAGPPNSGKSTLLNQLVGRSVAVTSPRAGTTKDWIGHTVDLNGLPIELIDTAGSECQPSHREDEAVETGRRLTDHADLVLWVFDGSQPPSSVARASLVQIQDRAGAVTVINKADLGCTWVEQSDPSPPGHGWVSVSALTGNGVDLLVKTIATSLGTVSPSDDQPCFFTERQVAIATGICCALRKGNPRPDDMFGRDLIGA